MGNDIGRHRFYGLMAAACALVAGACQPLPPPAPPPVAKRDLVGEALMLAADRSSEALGALSQVQQARTPPAKIDTAHVPADLRAPVTLSWSGPLVPVVRALAEEVGYEYATIGHRGPTPVIVTIQADKRPAFEVLQDLGFQAGLGATVAVDAHRRRIEVRYEAR